MLIVLCSSCKESTEDEKAMQQMVYVYFRSMLPNLVLNNQKRLIKIGMK